MAGFYREGTHQVVSCPQCGILAPEMDAVRDAVVDYMNQYRVSAYDEGSGTGLVRHIYVRKGWVSGQLLVCLVVNGTRLPRQEALLERLQRIPGFATLVLSVHQKPATPFWGTPSTPCMAQAGLRILCAASPFACPPGPFTR